MGVVTNGEGNVVMTKLEKAVREASELLLEYLGEFPEHDQGDHRVYAARAILQHELYLLSTKRGSKR